jgi:hypothetical protein
VFNGAAGVIDAPPVTAFGGTIFSVMVVSPYAHFHPLEVASNGFDSRDTLAASPCLGSVDREMLQLASERQRIEVHENLLLWGTTPERTPCVSVMETLCFQIWGGFFRLAALPVQHSLHRD